MLRRKNSQVTYAPQRQDQSPYRFQRKNVNLSPGLSPMRCRTPTKISNLSPFRAGVVNDNLRAHSPIKFVTGRQNNPQTNTFFRNENTTQNYNTTHNKYSTTTSNITNNDISSKKEAYQQYENSSKIKGYNQYNQRGGMHENTKLFSKLVQKLNCQKKKQPQLIKKNTKPQNYRQNDVSSRTQNNRLKQQPKFTKKKSQPSSNKLQLPNPNNIQPVQSVVYEQSQTPSVNIYHREQISFNYKKQQTTYNYTNYNKPANHEQKHQQKHHTPLKSNSHKTNNQNINLNGNRNGNTNVNVNLNRKQQKLQQIQKGWNQKIQLREKVNSNYVQIPSGQKNKYKQKQHVLVRQNKNNQYVVPTYANNNTVNSNKNGFKQQQVEFQDVKFYLDMLKQSKSYGMGQKNQQFCTNSNKYEINMSLMNMDPFI